RHSGGRAASHLLPHRIERFVAENLGARMNTDHRRNILVVDDDDSGRYASGRVLRRAGYEVIEAASGEEALRRVGGGQTSECGVGLPVIGGLEVWSRIKSAPETAGTLVLQMSASSVDDQARVAALESGADGYIVTPTDPSVLVATVRALLRLQTAEQAVAEA